MRMIPSALMARKFLVGASLGVSLLLINPAFASDNQQHAKPAIQSWAELQKNLGAGDQVAVLQALQLALNRIGDGGTFMWKKHDTNLKGIIKPTAAFRNAGGQICRHVIYMLSLGDFRKQIEIIACREADGRWRL